MERRKCPRCGKKRYSKKLNKNNTCKLKSGESCKLTTKGTVLGLINSLKNQYKHTMKYLTWEERSDTTEWIAKHNLITMKHNKKNASPEVAIEIVPPERP